MPTKAQVTEHVINFIAAAANLKPGKIALDDILTDKPLFFDSTGLGFLTLTLRGYIKNHQESQTITSAEVKKKNLTVQGLIDLVYSKVKDL